MLLGLAAQYAAKPKEIDPQKVMDMGTSPHNAELYERSLDLMNLNSDFNQDYFKQMNTAAQDNTYVANRVAKQNLNSSGMGNQTGILNQIVNKNMTDSNVGVQKNFENFVRGNMGMSNSLLGQVTQNDMAVRDNAVSAYGQNINNKNNWMASMAGNVTKMSAMPFELAKAAVGGGGGGEMGWGQIAGMAMCDATMKENIKPKGRAKTSDGKKVNIYNYNFKGRKKTHTGVLAQEVQKSHPQHVKKGKNGKLYVNLGGLFG